MLTATIKAGIIAITTMGVLYGGAYAVKKYKEIRYEKEVEEVGEELEDQWRKLPLEELNKKYRELYQ